MPTNKGNNTSADYPSPSGDIIDYPAPADESVGAGYEITDVNTGSVVVFLGGLFGFVIIFFFFCYFMGRVINNELTREDGKTDRWHQGARIFAGSKDGMGGAKVAGKREDLKSNAAMGQQEMSAMTKAFPGPRLQTDDGNDDTYQLHAREDLLLDHYSSVPGQPLRIPIERAMELIAAKGLPVSQAAQPAQKLAFDAQPTVQVPLTTGFARTGYELDQMEARKQRLEMPKPENGVEHAELKPTK